MFRILSVTCLLTRKALRLIIIPANGDRLHWRELLKLIRSRISRWQSGDISGLWSDFLASEGNTNRRRHVPKKPSNLDSLRAANARRARRTVEAGQYRKAIQALTSEGLSPPTSDILDEMLTKHPQSPLTYHSFSCSSLFEDL